MKSEAKTKDFTKTPPSGFATHLPFQGRLQVKIDLHGTKSQINHKDQSITTTTPKREKGGSSAVIGNIE
ncbi:MAG: hypothetical protein V8T52_08985 [Ruminococcus sp.]